MKQAINQAWFRVARAAAACLALALVIGLTAPATAAPRASAPGVKVYLMRGFLNVFSLGLDDFAYKLNARGIPAEVSNHLAWSVNAAEAAAAYKSGQLRTIIIIGHSLGGDAVVSMAEELGRMNVPVALAVTLDSVPNTVSGAHVNNFVNLYIGSGAMRAGPGFRGRINTIDLGNRMPVSHMSIDKTDAIHAMLMGYISQAVGGGRRKAAPAAPTQAGTESAPVQVGAAPATASAPKPQ